jgi:hypothetical protein
MRAARHRSSCLTWLLLAAMVAAQWLGLAHGVLHARAELPGAPAAQAVLSTAPAAQHHAWLSDLFGAHNHAGDCRLYDQLSSGSHAPPLAQASLPPSCAPQLPPRWVQRSWAAVPVPLFQARAPPALG